MAKLLPSNGPVPGLQPTMGIAGKMPGSALTRTMDSAGLGNAWQAWTNDAAVSGGYAFLTSELAKRDPKLREPLRSITYPRDIKIVRGGGWIDYTEVEFVDFGISGPNQYGLADNRNTQIPMVSANISKDIYRVFNFENAMEVSYIDLQKSQTIGRTLDNLLDNGIKLNWEKALDQVTYLGWVGYPGLVNNSAVAAASVAATGTSSSTLWVNKTAQQIMIDINALLVSTVASAQYDLSGMATHILIPWAQYGYLTNTIVSTAGNKSILTYLLENNLGKNQGIELGIFPCRQCAGAGVSGTDRMVGYVNDQDKVYLDIPVALQRVMTVPSVTHGMSYITGYAGQIGVVKNLYPQVSLYSDGI